MNIDTDTLQRVSAGLRYNESRYRRADSLVADSTDIPELEYQDGWCDGYAAAVASILGGITGGEVRGIAREEIDRFQSSADADAGIAHRLARLERG